MIEQFNNHEAHERLVDRVTDQAGRFPRGTGNPNTSGGAMSDGERHNIELEQRKRIIRQLARRFNNLARNREIERCLLAASKEINSQFLEQLEPQVRAKIEKNLHSDLTKIERTQLLSYF